MLTQILLATEEDRSEIYRIRHEVYAEELGQHSTNPEKSLSDALDSANEYIVARRAGKLLGFISITPPKQGTYSIEKYLSRKDFPFTFGEHTCEIRILTIRTEHRKTELALLLMYAALRWAEMHRMSQVIAMGRSALVPFYKRLGFHLLGKHVQSGAVQFEAMTATVTGLRAHLSNDHILTAILERGFAKAKWDLPFTHEDLAAEECVHGGDSFVAIGEDFRHLHRHAEIIAADVLDAWYEPAPSVTDALLHDLPWLIRTSPPTHASGVLHAIANARAIPEENLVVHAGSSSLIYLALRMWLKRTSRVLILDPMYGEYAHVCENLIGCTVERFTLDLETGFEINDASFIPYLQRGYDLVIMVNPNNPTGIYVTRERMERFHSLLPASTMFWIDEAYIDFVPESDSMEPAAARAENIVVCKTLSKAYALSGERIAYMVTNRASASSLRRWIPPWSVGLPAQLAAVEALNAREYYSARFRETQTLRMELVARLREIPGISVLSGSANFLLCRFAERDFNAFLADCREQGLYLRDVSSMGESAGSALFRIAVLDRASNVLSVEIIETILAKG